MTELRDYAIEGLKAIFRDDLSYRKVGIYLAKISPQAVI
jgi:hypothetical protein